MKKYISWIIIFFFLLISLANAELFPELHLKTKGSIMYEAHCLDNGKWYYTSFNKYKKFIKNKTVFYEFTFYLKEKDKFTFATSVFKNDGYFRPVKSIIKTGKNKLSTHKEIFFKNKQILIIDKSSPSPAEHELEIPEDTYSFETIAIGFLSLPLNDPQFKKHTCHVFMSENNSVFKIRLEKKEKETITTPAGTFKCYKLTIRPDLGFLNYLVDWIWPPIYVWLQAKKPHIPVKFEGPSAGIFSPWITVQLQVYEIE